MMNNLARKTAFEDCAEFIKFRHHLLDFFACDDRDEVKFALGWFDACVTFRVRFLILFLREILDES